MPIIESAGVLHFGSELRTDRRGGCEGGHVRLVSAAGAGAEERRSAGGLTDRDTSPGHFDFDHSVEVSR